MDRSSAPVNAEQPELPVQCVVPQVRIRHVFAVGMDMEAVAPSALTHFTPCACPVVHYGEDEQSDINLPETGDSQSWSACVEERDMVQLYDPLLADAMKSVERTKEVVDKMANVSIITTFRQADF